MRGSQVTKESPASRGVPVTYVAAVPIENPGLIRLGPELTEVRWVSLAEADRLTGGTVYGSVRAHLARVQGFAAG